MTYTYILDGKNPIPCDDILKWAKFMEEPSKSIVKKTAIGEVQVSTVFLGTNSALLPDHPAVLFETMVLGGKYDLQCWKYGTWEEAEEGHKEMVDHITQMLN